MYRGRGFESETQRSQTRESRRVDATNARFESRVQVITREEHRRGHKLRVASIQEHEDRVIQMSRTRSFALRNCLDAGVSSASEIFREKKGDMEK